MRGITRQVAIVPGRAATLASIVQFDPTSNRSIQRIYEVSGLSELGLRFPYHRDATAVTVVSSNTTLNSFRNEYDTLDIRGATLTCGVSPIWIACRRLVMDATAIINADGLGGAGGAGGAVGVNGSAGQAADLSVGSATLFRSLGGGGGGGGGQGVGGRQGGDGGRGGPNNAGGLRGAGNSGAGQQGSAATVRALLFDLLPLLNFTRGGAGGGGGGGGDSGGSAGGNGGPGGGGILITCEELACDPAAIIRARGLQGAPGGTTSFDGGNGGGGAGGWIVILTVRALSTPTLQVTGGAAQTAGLGGTGAAGRDGIAHIELVNAS
jgi:hypothetical protein